MSANASSVLCPLYDELNDLWLEAEKHLRAIKVSEAVRLKIGELQLAWQKVGQLGTWRICLVEQKKGIEVLKPMTDCPMVLRVQCIDYFISLKDTVEKTAENTIPRLAQAIVHFKGILSTE